MSIIVFFGAVHIEQGNTSKETVANAIVHRKRAFHQCGKNFVCFCLWEAEIVQAYIHRVDY